MQSEMESNLQDMRGKYTASETKRQQLDREMSESKYSLEKCENKLHLAQQQTRLFEKEVKSLRALLKSFDSEFKIGKPTVDHALAEKDKVIEDVRGQLDECRQEAKTLIDKLNEREDKIEKQKAVLSVEASVEQKPALDSAIVQSQKDEIALLKHQLQRLRDELFGLQKAAGQDFVPSQTRVLHLVNNPASVEAVSRGKTQQPPSQKFNTALEELRHLREENRRLQDLVIQRTDEISNSSSSSNSANQLSSSNVVDQSQQRESVMDTSAVVTAADANNTSFNVLGPDSNKMNQRLKEMFKERITCFREAVYLLTGYKIDLYSADASNGGHPRLRLRSMYAEDPDDSLLFQWRGNKLELMETPFAGKLDPRLFSMLQVSNSVPAFLCNVTLELFENQTFMG